MNGNVNMNVNGNVNGNVNDNVNGNGNVNDNLDWGSQDLLNALNIEQHNGFGFQCDANQSGVSRMYIAQPFNANGVSELCETTFLSNIREALPDIPPNHVWITDYLGRDYLTINVAQYNNIPLILNACLRSGYKFCTHTCLKALFKPGEVFNRETLERKIIENAQEQFGTFKDYRRYQTDGSVWKLVSDLNRFRPLLYHWNYCTLEGREFCTRVRLAMGKKPRSKANPRMLWPKYNEVTTRYGILHKGGWGAYEPDLGIINNNANNNNAIVVNENAENNNTTNNNNVNEEQNNVVAVGQKRPFPEAEERIEDGDRDGNRGASGIGEENEEEEEEEEDGLCLICMDNAATTIVLPCGHNVACDECSINLRNTPDNTKCVKCRCDITHVSYSTNEMEIK